MSQTQYQPEKCKKGKNRVKVSIIFKLLASTLIPLVLILTLVGVATGLQVSRRITQQTSDFLSMGAQAGANQTKAYFQTFIGEANGLATSTLIKDILLDTSASMTQSQYYETVVQELSQTQQRYNQDIMTTWLCDFRSGNVLRSNRELVAAANGFDYTSRNWYKLVMEKQGPVLTPAYDDATTNKRIVTVASPVYLNGSISGIIGINIQIERLNQAINELTIGEGGYVMLFDSNYTVLTHMDQDVIDKSIDEVQFEESFVQRLRNGEEMNGVRYIRAEFVNYGSVVRLDDWGYTVVGAMSESEFREDIVASIRTQAAGFVMCAVLLAIAVIIISMSITRPLKRLDDATARLANGELDVEVEVCGNDEISAIGWNTKALVMRLKDYIGYIDEMAYALEKLSEGNLDFELERSYVGEFARLKDAMQGIQHQISEILGNIARSAQQVNIGAEQISNGSQSLAQGATEQASAVEQLSVTVQQLSEQANDKSEEAVEAGRDLEQVRIAIDQSNEQMGALRQAMDDISKQANAISNIIKTIDDIAFQTNILALNAAVEAARAGSSGKGFAVVADEVRNLAGKSAAAAKETSELIARSTEAVEKGAQVTGLTAQSLAKVKTDTEQIVKVIDSVASTYREQALRMKEISCGVEQISSVVQTNSATAQQSAAASEELSSQANVMRDQIAQFKLKNVRNTDDTSNGYRFS